MLESRTESIIPGCGKHEMKYAASLTCCRLGREQLSRPVLTEVWFHAAWILAAAIIVPIPWLAGTALFVGTAPTAFSASLSTYLISP